MLLKDKVALITGAASGIGKGIARLFSEEGANVVLCDINQEGVKTAAVEIKKNTGNDTLPIIVDITNRVEVFDAVESAISEFKSINVLVNAAGIVRLAKAVDISEKDWDDTFAVNVKGALFFCQAVGKYMMKQKGGKFVNITSDSGKRPFPNEVAYCSSKSALIGMTRVFALELGPYNINSNAIAPGATDTPMLRTYFMKNEDDRKQYIAATALKRIAEPRDIAKVALFLASSLSDHVTGEIILTSAGDAFGE